MDCSPLHYNYAFHPRGEEGENDILAERSARSDTSSVRPLQRPAVKPSCYLLIGEDIYIDDTVQQLISRRCAYALYSLLIGK